MKHFDVYFRRPQPSQEASWTRRYNPVGSGGDGSGDSGSDSGRCRDGSVPSTPAPFPSAAAAAGRAGEAAAGTRAGLGVGAPQNDNGFGWRGDESVLCPDIFSYTHLISSLERLGRDRACLSALFEMRTRGIKVRAYHVHIYLVYIRV